MTSALPYGFSRSTAQRIQFSYSLKCIHVRLSRIRLILMENFRCFPTWSIPRTSINRIRFIFYKRFSNANVLKAFFTNIHTLDAYKASLHFINAVYSTLSVKVSLKPCFGNDFKIEPPARTPVKTAALTRLDIENEKKTYIFKRIYR